MDQTSSRSMGRSVHRYETTVFEDAEHGSWSGVAKVLQATTHRDHFTELEGGESEEEDTEELVAIVNSKEGSDNEASILMHAVKGGSFVVVEQLIAHGADVHITNEDGESAVTLAAKYDRIEIMKLLLGNGADITTSTISADLNITNVDGNTALMIAVAMGFHTIVQMLLDGGADSRVENKAGRTVWKMARTGEMRAVLEGSNDIPGSNWLVQRLKTWSVPVHVIRHCVRVLVEQAGFYAERTLLSLPVQALSYEYLHSLGITALGTQQVLMNVHAQVREGSAGSASTALTPAPVVSDLMSSTTNRSATATWLGEKLSGYGVPADRIAHCEKVLVHLQGFTSAAVLASLPFERFTCAYLQSVGITGLGLQQVLIYIKAALQLESHRSGAKTVDDLPTVYGAVPAVMLGERDLKRARQEDGKSESEE